MATTEALAFVTAAVVFGVAARLMHRHVVKDTSPYAYSWLTQIIAMLLFLPFALSNLAIPQTKTAWLVLIVAAIVWVLVDLSALTAYKWTEVSLKEPISQSKLIWALLFGLIFLGETITLQRAMGTIIIFLGTSLLLYHPERKFGRLSESGVRWTLLTALLSAIVAIIDKFALNWFVPEVYGFLVYLGPAIILTAFIPTKIKQVKHLIKNKWRSVFIAIFFSTATYFFTIQAYAKADVTFVYPLLQMGVLLTVLSGIFFMKEREHFWQKIIAATMIVIGAIIIGI